jgi:hypothetical protein
MIDIISRVQYKTHIIVLVGQQYHKNMKSE